MDDGIKICKEAQKIMWSVMGLTYDNACKLIEELEATEKIEANIVPGGVRVYSNGCQKLMFEICKKYNTVPQRGLTRMQESVILNNFNKKKHLKSVKIALRKLRAEIRKEKGRLKKKARRKARRTT